jgi:hypothetical protein
MTPQYYLILKSFLSRDKDRQFRSIFPATKTNEKMLKLWGVRFIITDYVEDIGVECLSTPVPKSSPIRLYDLGAANTGEYSPRHVHAVNSFAEGISYMRRLEFNPLEVVVTTKKVEGDFVPANNASIMIYKDFLRIKAESAGHSLLVLPIQYSNCLELSDSSTELFRANLLQLGIKFHKKVDASLRLSINPLGPNRCRGNDIKDMEMLDVTGRKGGSQ